MKMSKKESKFQSDLRKEIEDKFPGSFVLKNDPSHIQGFPDLTVLYKNKWACLECKKSAKESFQPNQEYYIHKLNELSFARVIYPENKEEVLDELQKAFRARRSSRVPKCELIQLAELRQREIVGSLDKHDGESKRYGTS